MRVVVGGLLLVLCGCGPGLVFNSSPEMSPQEMLERATLVVVGVIQKQQFDPWPFYRLNLPGPIASTYWRVLRREVRVETVLRGMESRSLIDVYEFYWTGGASGNWNSTSDGQRALFLLRKEAGKYHVVRDWWRSIFPVASGPHARLPLDDSHPLWERIALMNWWVPRNFAELRTKFHYNDPGFALSEWRVVKLERGLLRHPSSGVRIPACRELLLLRGWGQDECWEMLSDAERAHLSDGGYFCCSAKEIADIRQKNQERTAEWWWSRYEERESRRLLTAMNNAHIRAEFCRIWEHEYPGDLDNACPADQPPPATIVTEQGDIPLLGPWPR